MEYFPLSHDLHDRLCLIVGAGAVALRKSELLLRAGARLLVVAPRVDQAFLPLSRHAPLTIELREYREADLDGCWLVIAATGDQRVNAEVSRNATARRIPVNVVDQAELCSCFFPSIIDRSPIVVAISTAGHSPTLARWLREQIERLVPGRAGALARFMAGIRPEVKARLESGRRRAFYEQLIDGPVGEAVLAGDEAGAQRLFRKLLDAADSGSELSIGEIYLVGAGPGDPDLLTLRAFRLMQKADVCLYDNLVSAPILEMVRRDASREYVGKRRNLHSMPQEAINDKLVRLAREGKKVLRLKGGDPFVFGRGGEEIEFLAAEKIPFQVVPGVTAANGCACYAGIPLTHRDYSQSVRFVTGHQQSGGAELPWAELVAENQTIVVYMGLVNLEFICARLVQHGRRPSTPIALISRGTLPEQAVYVGTLETLPSIVAQAKVHAPTLIIIGDVVRARQQLV